VFPPEKFAFSRAAAMGEQSRMQAVIQEKRPQFFSVSRFFCISLMDDQQQKAPTPRAAAPPLPLQPPRTCSTHTNRTIQSKSAKEKSPWKAIRVANLEPSQKITHAESLTKT